MLYAGKDEVDDESLAIEYPHNFLWFIKHMHI